MKYNPYPKRDPIKNCFISPNELFILDLTAEEIATYSFLLCRENRKTYQCHPSYKSIGRAIKKSVNSVRKYVAGLEDKGLIVTEPTSIVTKSGRKQNGSLLYHLRPIQEAVNRFNDRQFARMDEELARQRAADKLAKLAPVTPCEPLCGLLESAASPSPTEDNSGGIEAVSDEEPGTKEKAG